MSDLDSMFPEVRFLWKYDEKMGKFSGMDSKDNNAPGPGNKIASKSDCAVC